MPGCNGGGGGLGNPHGGTIGTGGAGGAGDGGDNDAPPKHPGEAALPEGGGAQPARRHVPPRAGHVVLGGGEPLVGHAQDRRRRVRLAAHRHVRGGARALSARRGHKPRLLHPQPADDCQVPAAGGPHALTRSLLAHLGCCCCCAAP